MTTTALLFSCSIILTSLQPSVSPSLLAHLLLTLFPLSLSPPSPFPPPPPLPPPLSLPPPHLSLSLPFCSLLSVTLVLLPLRLLLSLVINSKAENLFILMGRAWSVEEHDYITIAATALGDKDFMMRHMNVFSVRPLKIQHDSMTGDLKPHSATIGALRPTKTLLSHCAYQIK